jgi:hypothetical protein
MLEQRDMRNEQIQTVQTATHSDRNQGKNAASMAGQTRQQHKVLQDLIVGDGRDGRVRWQCLYFQ